MARQPRNKTIIFALLMLNRKCNLYYHPFGAYEQAAMKIYQYKI